MRALSLPQASGETPRGRERSDFIREVTVLFWPLIWSSISVALLAIRFRVGAVVFGVSGPIDAGSWLAGLAFLASLSRVVRTLATARCPEGSPRLRVIDALETVRQYAADEEPTDAVAA
jgi:hypothetical protein